MNNIRRLPVTVQQAAAGWSPGAATHNASDTFHRLNYVGTVCAAGSALLGGIPAFTRFHSAHKAGGGKFATTIVGATGCVVGLAGCLLGAGLSGVQEGSAPWATLNFLATAAGAVSAVTAGAPAFYGKLHEVPSTECTSTTGADSAALAGFIVGLVGNLCTLGFAFPGLRPRNRLWKTLNAGAGFLAAAGSILGAAPELCIVHHAKHGNIALAIASCSGVVLGIVGAFGTGSSAFA